MSFGWLVCHANRNPRLFSQSSTNTLTHSFIQSLFNIHSFIHSKTTFIHKKLFIYISLSYTWPRYSNCTSSVTRIYSRCDVTSASYTAVEVHCVENTEVDGNDEGKHHVRSLELSFLKYLFNKAACSAFFDNPPKQEGVQNERVNETAIHFCSLVILAHLMVSAHFSFWLTYDFC